MEKDGKRFQLPKDDFEQWQQRLEEAVAAAYGEEDKEKKKKPRRKARVRRKAKVRSSSPPPLTLDTAVWPCLASLDHTTLLSHNLRVPRLQIVRHRPSRRCIFI